MITQSYSLNPNHVRVQRSDRAMQREPRDNRTCHGRRRPEVWKPNTNKGPVKVFDMESEKESVVLVAASGLRRHR